MGLNALVPLPLLPSWRAEAVAFLDDCGTRFQLLTGARLVSAPEAREVGQR